MCLGKSINLLCNLSQDVKFAENLKPWGGDPFPPPWWFWEKWKGMQYLLAYVNLFHCFNNIHSQLRCHIQLISCHICEIWKYKLQI